ncbi:hypothetical protein MRX96_029711 [Rhipicephalus microplus]
MALQPAGTLASLCAARPVRRGSEMYAVYLCVCSETQCAFAVCSETTQEQAETSLCRIYCRNVKLDEFFVATESDALAVLKKADALFLCPGCGIEPIKTGTVEGFVDLGKFTQEEDRTTPADHGMVMMFQPFQATYSTYQEARRHLDQAQYSDVKSGHLQKRKVSKPSRYISDDVVPTFRSRPTGSTRPSVDERKLSYKEAILFCNIPFCMQERRTLVQMLVMNFMKQTSCKRLATNRKERCQSQSTLPVLLWNPPSSFPGPSGSTYLSSDSDELEDNCEMLDGQETEAGMRDSAMASPPARAKKQEGANSRGWKSSQTKVAATPLHAQKELSHTYFATISQHSFHGAAQKVHLADEFTIEAAVREWLRHAPARHRNAARGSTGCDQ